MTEAAAATSDTMWDYVGTRCDVDHRAEVLCSDDCVALPQPFWDAPRTQPPTRQHIIDAYMNNMSDDDDDDVADSPSPDTVDELHIMARAYAAARAIMVHAVETAASATRVWDENTAIEDGEEVSVWADRDTGAVSLMTDPIGDMGDVWLHAFASMDALHAAGTLHRFQGDWISLGGGFSYFLPVATVERLERLAFGTTDERTVCVHGR